MELENKIFQKYILENTLMLCLFNLEPNLVGTCACRKVSDLLHKNVRAKAMYVSIDEDSSMRCHISIKCLHFH